MYKQEHPAHADISFIRRMTVGWFKVCSLICLPLYMEALARIKTLLGLGRSPRCSIALQRASAGFPRIYPLVLPLYSEKDSNFMAQNRQFLYP